MTTWDFDKAPDKTCPNCETVYEVQYHQVPMKDVDSFNCSTCGLELDSWKSTRYPIFKLKTKGKWLKDKPAV